MLLSLCCWLRLRPVIRHRLRSPLPSSLSRASRRYAASLHSVWHQHTTNTCHLGSNPRPCSTSGSGWPASGRLSAKTSLLAGRRAAARPLALDRASDSVALSAAPRLACDRQARPRVLGARGRSVSRCSCPLCRALLSSCGSGAPCWLRAACTSGPTPCTAPALKEHVLVRPDDRAQPPLCASRLEAIPQATRDK